MLLNLSEVIEKRSPLARPFKGTVVDNNDPLKLGRVKCTIEGLLELDGASLPWITQNAPSFVGGVSGKGILAIPEVGSELKIEFPFEDIYSGEYVGFWPSKSNTVGDTADYPNKVGFIIGDFKLTFVKPSGEFVIEHPNGSKIKIGEDGKISIDSSKDVEIKSATNITLNGEGGQVLTTLTDPVVDMISGVPTQGVVNVKAGL